jgi:hypothetical protein
MSDGAPWQSRSHDIIVYIDRDAHGAPQVSSQSLKMMLASIRTDLGLYNKPIDKQSKRMSSKATYNRYSKSLWREDSRKTNKRPKQHEKLPLGGDETLYKVHTTRRFVKTEDRDLTFDRQIELMDQSITRISTIFYASPAPVRRAPDSADLHIVLCLGYARLTRA